MPKKSDKIELTKEERKDAAAELRSYINENIAGNIDETDGIGNLQTDMLLSHILNGVTGQSIYNRAIQDAMTFMADKVDDMYLLMKGD